MTLRRKRTTAQHEISYQEVVALLNRHAGKLDAVEVLAIAANMVGKLVALQDQRRYSPEQAMEIVAKNIEEGNAQALQEVKLSKGSA
jgi:hypothetical protein